MEKRFSGGLSYFVDLNAEKTREEGAAAGSTQEQAEDHGGIGSHAALGVINRGAQRLIRVSS